MDLSIIIINWNSTGYVSKCLCSIYENTQGIQFEVIVLDNGSFDGCGDILAREFSQVRFIQSKENLGFAKGNNMAAKRATGRLLLFLNPDTEVHGPTLNRLFEAACSLPHAGALGARLLNTNGTLQTSCLQAFPTIANQVLDADILRTWFPRASLWGTAPLYSPISEPVLVEGISGACLATPRAVFQQVVGFSEDYFMYFEDMDYCLKLHRAGWKTYYVPQAEVIHHGGRSSSEAPSKFASVMMAESAWRFFQKQRGPVSAGLFRVCLAAKAMARSCLLGCAFALPWPKLRRQRLKGMFWKWAFITRWAFGAERWAACQ
jgi:hypothetical protein